MYVPKDFLDALMHYISTNHKGGDAAEDIRLTFDGSLRRAIYLEVLHK